MKTKQELDALKEEIEKLNQKLAELTEEELQQVAGGVMKRYPSTNPTSCPAVGTIVYVHSSEGQLARPASPGRYKLRALGDDE